MTLTIRNGVLALAFILLLAQVLGYGVLAFLLVTREGWGAVVGEGTLLRLLLGTVAVPIVSLAGFLLVRRAYRKSAAPEVFFFSLFLATLAGESLLLLQAWVTFAGMASYFTALLTRVVWAFRFTGLFLLFCSSLYAFDFPFRKYGNLVLASVAAGVFLAVLLPLHSSSARNHLLFAVGDAPGMVLVTGIFAAVATLNFVAGALRAGSVSTGFRAWAAVSFVTAWALSIVFGPWAIVLGVPGVVLVSWKAEQSPVFG